MATTSASLSDATAAVHAGSAASSLGDPQHIYLVAARSLRDCIELLLSLKAAMATEEQEQRLHETSVAGCTNGSIIDDHSNGHQKSPTVPGKSMRDIHHMSRSASQEADANSGEVQALLLGADRAPSALPQAITPCKRSEMYTKPSVLACQGTIGKHVRHLHDHYRILLSTYPPSQVPMETDIDYAIHELERLQLLLENHQKTKGLSDSSPATHTSIPHDLQQPITLQATIDPCHPPVRFHTTFGRELWFCSLHAVHHFAMIKVICGEFGMSLTEGFGLAPSTVKSRLLHHKH
ncbi:hypothetical protein BGX28_004752 [Mortierella sp. GBA30]|nr:hypothetical protein BGX28_004752 [Mortierella sp. GBA30]